VTRRLLLSYLGLTLVVLAALEIPLAINYGDRLRNDLSADLARDSFAIAGFAEETVEGHDDTDLSALAARYAERTGGRVIIVGGDGRVLADSRVGASDDFSSRPEIEQALQGEVATGTRRSDTLDTDLLYVAVPIASGGNVEGAVRITYSTEQINDRWRGYILALLGIAAVSLAAAAALGVLFARWVARPLRQLEHAAVGLGSGELSARAPEADGPPEVRALATTFNTMAAQLDDLMEAQESFVADASHQLRTPLAALRLRMENLQSELETGESASPTDAGRQAQARQAARADLDAALTETARLSRIVDGLLALARADRSGMGAVERMVVDEVLADRCDAWQPIAAEHGARIEVASSSLHLLATEDRLTQALDNLLANAIEAAREGGRIEMHAELAPLSEASDRGAGGVVELHVSDNGAGLTADERSHAFDRFWRASPESGQLGGSGLGLAIARKLVRADHGDLELRQAEAGGLDAVIRLPSS
jgi:signal transduction histidine kinase